MNMLIEYDLAGRAQFRQVFAEGATEAEAVFREWLGRSDYEVPVIAIYRAASTTDGKHDESRVAIQWWSNVVPGWEFISVHRGCSVAQALTEPPREDARPFGAWVAV